MSLSTGRHTAYRSRLFQYGSADTWFQSVLRYQIHFPLEEAGEIQHQSGVVHEIDLSTRQEFNQYIDVAVGPHLSAGHRSEKESSRRRYRRQRSSSLDSSTCVFPNWSMRLMIVFLINAEHDILNDILRRVTSSA